MEHSIRVCIRFPLHIDWTHDITGEFELGRVLAPWWTLWGFQGYKLSDGLAAFGDGDAFTGGGDFIHEPQTLCLELRGFDRSGCTCCHVGHQQVGGSRNWWMAILIQAQCTQSDHVVDHDRDQSALVESDQPDCWMVATLRARNLGTSHARSPAGRGGQSNHSNRLSRGWASPTESRNRWDLGPQQSCWLAWVGPPAAR